MRPRTDPLTIAAVPSRWIFAATVIHSDAVIAQLSGWAEVARREGVLALESRLPECADAFTRNGLQILGVASANLIFLPIAGKLRTLIQAQVTQRELVLDGLLGIAYGIRPRERCRSSFHCQRTSAGATGRGRLRGQSSGLARRLARCPGAQPARDTPEPDRHPAAPAGRGLARVALSARTVPGSDCAMMLPPKRGLS